jgi:LPXTG-motif cell wall-anchored protein
MVKLFRVGFAFFVSLVCVISPVSFSVVSPAWAVTEWTQVGADIDGEAAGDQSGGSVALSSDGSRVAIGARANDGGGDAAGQLRVYDLIGDAWVQVGSDIDGEAAGDESGGSVALSSDGSRATIGARLNGGSGISAGHVRVYGYPVPEDENETPSEELAETGGVDASGIAFSGAIALVVGVGGYLLRRRGARA